MMVFYSKTKFSSSFIRKLGFALLIILTISLSIGAGFWVYNNLPQKISKASSIAFADGNVSIDKKYVQNNQELDSISTTKGSQVTVRLKYNNTSTQSSTNNYILDSIPAGFSFVSGSLKNCYADAVCSSLNNNLFSGQNIQVAPGAGYFGYGSDNSQTQSNLELGRKKYFNLTECDYNTANVNITYNRTPASSATNTIPSTPTCQDTGYGTGTANLVTVDITGFSNMYISECDYTTSNGALNYNRTGINGANNGGAVSTSCQGTGYGAGTPHQMNFNLLGNRYVHFTECDYNAGTITYNRTGNFTANNSPSHTTVCTATGWGEAVGGTDILSDLSDTGRGYGYIEYKITSPNTSGAYGTNVALSGSFSGTNLVDTAQNTIFVEELNCEYVYPTNGIRTVNLGDAELRTDQDFSCNVNPRICPVVFLDANSNGQNDLGETIYDNITVQLRSQDGATLINTLQTSNTSSVCFEPLKNATNYTVTLPSPPEGNSTSGGNSINVPVVLDSGDISARFGFFSGSLSLTTSQSINLPAVTISATNQQTCSTLTNLQVIDSRLSNPGWTLTATVADFQDSNLNLTMPIANRFSVSPKTVTIVSGGQNQLPTPGQTTTITSSQDPFSVMSAGSGFGKGTFSQDMDVCQVVTPLDYSGSFQTIITFTVV